jgi:hypothetical protein
MRVIKKLGLEQTQPPSNVVSLAPPQSKLDVNQIGKMLRNEKAKFSLAASVYSLSRKFGYDNSRSRQVVDQYLFGLLGEHILDKMGLSNNAILSFEEVPPLCTNGVGKEFKTISELSNMVFLAPEKVLEKLKDMGFIGSDGEVSTNGVGSIIGSGPEALYHEDLKEIL